MHVTPRTTQERQCHTAGHPRGHPGVPIALLAREHFSATRCHTAALAQVWVLDSNPGLLPKDTSDVALVMEEIGHIPVPLRSRDDMVAHLQVQTSYLICTFGANSC